MEDDEEFDMSEAFQQAQGIHDQREEELADIRPDGDDGASEHDADSRVMMSRTVKKYAELDGEGFKCKGCKGYWRGTTTKAAWHLLGIKGEIRSCSKLCMLEEADKIYLRQIIKPPARHQRPRGMTTSQKRKRQPSISEDVQLQQSKTSSAGRTRTEFDSAPNQVNDTAETLSLPEVHVVTL